jgi:L-ascorbate metabolism protein UlaG (beta-lactamase superfamily)
MPSRIPFLGGHGNDPSVSAELNWARFASDLPAGLSIEWLGTAGFRIELEGTVVYIDPYVTRLPLSHVLSRRSALPSADSVATHVAEADAVLVGHTHFDHAMDVPLIAARTGCRVYGSASLHTLMSLHGLADRTVRIEPHRTYEVGPFEVSFVPSLHSKLVLGVRVPSDGEITCDSLDALTASAYCCGDVMGILVRAAGTTIYHQGSANLVEDELPRGGVDFFLAGIAGRAFTRDYTARILRRLEPRVVVPQHHDNFFRPLDAPMGFSFNVNLGGFVEDVARVSADFDVRTLDLLQTVSG